MVGSIRAAAAIGLFLSCSLYGTGTSAAAGVETIYKLVTKAVPHTIKVEKVLRKLKTIEERARQKANKFAEAAMKADPVLVKAGGAAGIGVRVGFDDPDTVEFFEGTSKDIRLYGFTVHPVIANAFGASSLN